MVGSNATSVGPLPADGTAVAWGADYNGQLGDGSTGDPSCTCRKAPVLVSGLSGVVAVAAGDALIAFALP